jgi:CheY-like chemotaxis protein
MNVHRVLVVDDEEMIRESLVEFLDENGYQAIGAVHGGDALEKLKTLDPPPCVILLDLMMPVVDGAAFRERQLGDPMLSDIPVIVLSAYQGVAKRAAELQITDFLDKPLKLQSLLGLIRKHCPTDGNRDGDTSARE